MMRSGMTIGLLAALALAAAGCGSAPRAVEVTEVWTSGDERALGIEGPLPQGSTAEQATPEAAPAGDD